MNNLLFQKSKKIIEDLTQEELEYKLTTYGIDYELIDVVAKEEELQQAIEFGTKYVYEEALGKVVAYAYNGVTYVVDVIVNWEE